MRYNKQRYGILFAFLSAGILLTLCAILSFGFIAADGTAFADDENEIYWGIVTDENGVNTLVLGGNQSDLEGTSADDDYSGNYFADLEDNIAPWKNAHYFAFGDIPTISAVEIKSKIQPTDISHWFEEMKFTSADLKGLENLDTSLVTSMTMLFYACSELDEIDLSGWDTGNLTSIYFMFDSCHKLTSVNLSGWDLTNAETESGRGVFKNCTSLNKIVMPEVMAEDFAIELPATFWNGTDMITEATMADCGKTPVRHDAHDLEYKEAADVTCSEDGNAEYWACTICEKYFSDESAETEITDKDSVVITALGHDYGDWTVVKEADCTQKGSRERVCSRNEEHVDREVIPALGHDFGDWAVVKEATCEEEGLEERVCRRNEEHKETEPDPALGHDYGEWTVTKEATKEETGEKVRVCSRDETHVETREIPKVQSYGGFLVIFILILLVAALVVGLFVSFLFHDDWQRKRRR